MRPKRTCKPSWRLFLLLAVGIVTMMCGCARGDDDDDRVRDLESSIVAEADAPAELQTIIAEKKMQPFKLTYTDDQNLFIVVGYGPQETGGYSIELEELFLTDNAIVVETELQGPEKGETVAPEMSYPVIIIRTELLEYPVTFR